MLIKKVIKINHFWVIISFLITFLLLLASNPQSSFADISVDSYCQLTIQSMQLEISNFQELIALVNQYQSDPETLAQQEDIKRAQFDEAKNALYSSFGTTAEEYILYMGNHKNEVEQYLENNQGIKQQIESLSAQLNALIENYESLKESLKPPEPPLQ